MLDLCRIFQLQLWLLYLILYILVSPIAINMGRMQQI